VDDIDCGNGSASDHLVRTYSETDLDYVGFVSFGDRFEYAPGGTTETLDLFPILVVVPALQEEMILCPYQQRSRCLI
jgi:hypothetical protein